MMKKIPVTGMAVLLLLAFWSCNRQVPDVRIIPEPAQMEIGTGMVRLPSDKPIYTSSNDSLLLTAAGYLGDRLHIHAYKIGQPNPGKCIYLELVTADPGSNPEGYTLVTGREGIVIRGNSARGVFYGIQSLMQLLPPEVYGEQGLADGQKVRLPVVNIQDEPRFRWRGMHLDVGRHFFSVDFIKKYIDMLAMHKMNVFHWHLTEDQGWRIEIKKYPLLTEIGSVREEPDGSTYGGYYTQDQIRDVVAYAASRFIDVMPEIEMPGHSVAALAAYPEYSCTGGPFKVRTAWGVSEDVLCAGKEKTYGFMENILSEVISLFPFPYIHVGGDECPKTRWKKCPDCQRRIRTEGLKDEMELQSYFIRRIEKFLISKNRHLVGWDEILEGGLAPEATVMSWRGETGGIEAAHQGHDVIMSPNSYCYFDHYQGDSRFEPKAIGGFLPMEKVYSYEPVPEGLSVDEARHVLGAQANLWTEYIPTEQQAEYMALPRMSALAEVVWSPKSVRDYEGFLHRMDRQYKRFDAMKLNYRVPVPVTSADSFVFTDTLSVDLHTPVDGAEILFTTDGTDPVDHGTVYTQPILLKASDTIKSVTRLKSGKTSREAEIVAVRQDMEQGFDLAMPVTQGIDFRIFVGPYHRAADLDDSQKGIRGVVKSFGLPENGPAGPFGMIMEGYIRIDNPGIYRFYLRSDDGSTLTVGDRLVVNHDGPHGPTEKSGETALGKGWHRYVLRYFDAGGGRTLQVKWSSKGMEKQPVPESNLASMATPIRMR